MADGLRLLKNRQMILIVRSPRAVVICHRSANVQIIAGQGKVVRITRYFIQPCQSRLDNLVAGRDFNAPLMKGIHQQVCKILCNLQQRGLAGCLIMRHRGFKQMAGIIEFVAGLEIRPGSRPAPDIDSVGADGIKIAGEKSVVRLSRRNFDNQFIQILIQRRIGLNLKRITGPFEGLVNIRIVKGKIVAACSGHQPAGNRKIINSSGLLKFAENIRDGNLLIGLLTRQPKVIRKVHLSKRDGLEQINGAGPFFDGYLQNRLNRNSLLLTDFDSKKIHPKVADFGSAGQKPFRRNSQPVRPADFAEGQLEYIIINDVVCERFAVGLLNAGICFENRLCPKSRRLNQQPVGRYLHQSGQIIDALPAGSQCGHIVEVHFAVAG